jgi:phosphatidylglycerophosphate synthase
MMPRRVQAGEQNPVGVRLQHDLLRHLHAAVLLAALGAQLLARALGLGTAYLAAVGAALAAGTLLLLALRDACRASHPHPAFGAANRVTLGRAVGAVLLFGLAFEPPTEPRAWAAVVLAGAAAALDAVDGRLARRGGLASRFGARFDMETDALMILVLAALAWRWERAGAWVLLAGLLRYAFVVAGAAWPWLAGELAPSRRRQAICVVQVVGLIVALVPWLPATPAGAVAAMSLGALCYSFALDVRALARRRSTEGIVT